jgi:putative ABC transport system substrate-binding protein
MRRRQLVLGMGAALASPFPVFSQGKRNAVIGFLGSESAKQYAPNLDGLRAGLRELGYVEGKNLKIEYRWAEGHNDRLPALAAELVRLKVDVLVTHGTPGTMAAKKATSTIPIVMASSGDALGSGLIASLSQPDANVTGMTLLLPELSAKRLQLMKEISPRMTRVASLFNPGNPAYTTDIASTDKVAKTLKLTIGRFPAIGPSDFESAFAAMEKARMEAVLVHQDGMLNANPKSIADLSRKHRLLSAGFEEFGEAGGVIGYGVNFPQMYRRTAVFVDKLLKGAKVRDLPVEQPLAFNLIVNLKTAAALGIRIPPSLLQRADRVIQV